MKSKKNENFFLNLIVNIVLPTLILMKGHFWFGLNPLVTLILALIFPVVYGTIHFITAREYNLLSIIGLASILLTGGIGVLKLPKEWIAFKEAIIPLAIGLFVLFSLKTKTPLVKVLLYNSAVFNTEMIDQTLSQKGEESNFKKLLYRCTYFFSFSFLLSAILNFILAKLIIVSETGTHAFNAELGKLTAWSYPIIAVPCMVVVILVFLYFIRGIQRLTGLPFEQLFESSRIKK